MTLTSGARLGSYEVVAQIGAGGTFFDKLRRKVPIGK
jgi:hypothetical protein